MAKNYCVCLLFNKDLSKTLLIKKAKGKLFEDQFNGLGGKLEKDETPIQACIREVYEESSGKISLKEPTHLSTIIFPHQEHITLHTFYDVIDEVTLPDAPEGSYHWMPVEFLLDFENEQIVGYGNLSYFCKLSLLKIKGLV